MKISPVKNLLTLSLTAMTVITVIVLLTAAYGGMIDPRTWVHPSLFTLGFPIVALISVIEFVVLMALRHRVAASTLCGALLLSLPAIHTHMPMSWGVDMRDSARVFSVMTWNVCRFNDENPSSVSTMQHIIDVNADIVILQETSSQATDYLDLPTVSPLKKEFKKLYPYYSKGYHDLGIFSKVPYTIIPDTVMRNNYLILTNDTLYHQYGQIFSLEIKGQKLKIINLHMQSYGLTSEDKDNYTGLTSMANARGKKEQLKFVKNTMLDKLKSAIINRANEAHDVRQIIDNCGDNVIVCGDFNDTPGSYCYRTIMGDDMKDSYVECGTLPIITFNSNHMYFKIDHILYRGNLKAIQSRCDKVGTSDHYPLVTTFEWQ